MLKFQVYPSPDNQEELIELLSSVIDLAFTLLKMSEVEAKNYLEHCQSALRKAQEALNNIRRFQQRILDPVKRQEIHSQANQLQAAIERLRQGFGRPFPLR